MKKAKKLIISHEYSERISAVFLNLRKSVSEIQIFNWLQNFEEKEWDLALTVLEKLKYFTLSDIIYEFDENLKRILADIQSNQKVFIHGLGEFGKSGSSLIYYIKQTPTYKQNSERIKILDHIKKIKQQGLSNNSYLILVDDIIGSGESLTQYFNHNIKQQLTKEKIKINTIVLCIAYMEHSSKKLIENFENLTLYGTKYKKAFASGSSAFGYRPKMLPIRNFCYNYGLELFKIFDREQGKDVHHPLGYNKSQALVVFAHSVPNNTLPIIWSSAAGWRPLFPRSSKEKISQSKDFRNQTLHWLNIAYSLNIFDKKHESDKIFFKDMNYKLIALMRLKRRGSIDPIICQVLGISVNELNEVLKEAILRNILDNAHNFTDFGLSKYEELKKKIQITNSIENRKYFNLNKEKLYVPKTFLGRT